MIEFLSPVETLVDRNKISGSEFKITLSQKKRFFSTIEINLLEKYIFKMIFKKNLKSN